MTRKDLSHNVLEVEHSEGIERWLVVKTTLHPKKVTPPPPPWCFVFRLTAFPPSSVKDLGLLGLLSPP